MGTEVDIGNIVECNDCKHKTYYPFEKPWYKRKKLLLNTQLRVIVLEKIVEHLLNNRPVSQQDMEKFREEAMSDIQRRFPNAGIQRK